MALLDIDPTSYEPITDSKKQFILTQIDSMQTAHYRNTLDLNKLSIQLEDTQDKYKSVLEQKMHEYELQNEEIELSIDLFNKELAKLNGE